MSATIVKIIDKCLKQKFSNWKDFNHGMQDENKNKLKDDIKEIVKTIKDEEIKELKENKITELNIIKDELKNQGAYTKEKIKSLQARFSD